jgi:hypothetical protein
LTINGRALVTSPHEDDAFIHAHVAHRLAHGFKDEHVLKIRVKPLRLAQRQQLARAFEVDSQRVELQQVGAVLALPDLAAGHAEGDVFGGARAVFPAFQRRAAAVAGNFPLIGLFDHLAEPAQG